MRENIQRHCLRQLPLARDPRVAGHRDEVLCGLVGDDIDDTSDGIATIQ